MRAVRCDPRKRWLARNTCHHDARAPVGVNIDDGNLPLPVALRATVQRHDMLRLSEVVQAGAATCETGFGAVKRTNTRPYEPTASNINSTLERSYDDGSLMQHNNNSAAMQAGYRPVG